MIFNWYLIWRIPNRVKFVILSEMILEFRQYIAEKIIIYKESLDTKFIQSVLFKEFVKFPLEYGSNELENIPNVFINQSFLYR